MNREKEPTDPKRGKNGEPDDLSYLTDDALTDAERTFLEAQIQEAAQRKKSPNSSS